MKHQIFQFIKKVGTERKFYNLSIECLPNSKLYKVVRHYGGFKKDGITKNTGTTTSTDGFTLEEAKNEVSSQTKKLLTKGYISVEESRRTGKTYTERPNQTNLCPTLPKVFPSNDRLSYYAKSNEWWFQIKRDGNHGIIPIVQDGIWVKEINYHNRKGQRVAIPDGAESILESLSLLLEKIRSNSGSNINQLVVSKNLALNGELVFTDAKGKDHRTNDQALVTNWCLPKFICFDVIGYPTAYSQRYHWLLKFISHVNTICTNSLTSNPLELVETSKTYKWKLAMISKVKDKGLEGLVLKDRTSYFEPGKTSSMYKYKLYKEDDFIVVGFTKPNKGERFNRGYIGALVLAQYDHSRPGKTLKPKGLVGGGFSYDNLEQVNKLIKNKTYKNDTYFNDKTYGKTEKSITWLAKKDWFVIESQYVNLTEYGIPFNPSFVRIRSDKQVDECIETEV